MNTQTLIAAGFIKHDVNKFLKSMADEHFQRRITENGVVCYFVDVYVYHWENSNHTYMSEATLYPKSDDHWYTLQIHNISDWSPKRLLEKFAHIYKHGPFGPDHHNQN